MIPQVNVKARIDRHSRILKENLSLKSKLFSRLKKNRLWYKIVILSMVFLMPVYPIFASFVYNNNEYEFIREWYIDESSILGSYYSDKKEEELDQLYEAKDSFLSVSTVLDDNRDLSGTNEISNYVVKDWDSLSSIATNYKVSKDTIIWANKLKNNTLKPWTKLVIPPVSWVLYKVKKWETVDVIAQRYKIKSAKIKDQNLIWDRKDLRIWELLVLPWAKKYVAPKVVPKPTYANNSKYKAKGKKSYGFAKASKSQYSASRWVYKLNPKPSYHTFYRGNCTRYVARYKTVKWGWNANAWLRNARAKGYPTGRAPTLGSIVVFSGWGYNPRYGHVGIVMEVKKDYIIISDMNYRRLWEVTYRKVSKWDRAIRWYIYVN